MEHPHGGHKGLSGLFIDGVSGQCESSTVHADPSMILALISVSFPSLLFYLPLAKWNIFYRQPIRPLLAKFKKKEKLTKRGMGTLSTSCSFPQISSWPPLGLLQSHF